MSDGEVAPTSCTPEACGQVQTGEVGVMLLRTRLLGVARQL